MANNNGTLTWTSIRGIVFVASVIVAIAVGWANLSNQQEALCRDLKRMDVQGSMVARQNQIVITEMRRDLAHIIEKQEEAKMGQQEIINRLDTLRKDTP